VLVLSDGTDSKNPSIIGMAAPIERRDKDVFMTKTSVRGMRMLGGETETEFDGIAVGR
jgi:hypothetical protein